MTTPKCCATCKWWWDAVLKENFYHGVCQAPDINPTWGAEVHIEVDEPNIGAQLITREDFGCTLHEEREDYG